MIGAFALLESPLMGEFAPEEVMFGRSSTTNTIQKRVEKAANAKIPVLLQGKTGAGKEILTRFIQCQSHGGNGAFIELGCPARVRFASCPRRLAGIRTASPPMRIEHSGEAWELNQ
jgi:transcriptional regulator of acetoin/glycerol metabolism